MRLPPEEVAQLKVIMEQARDRLRASRAEAKQAYTEMKLRDPEFWKKMGFQSEGEFLQYFDLADLVHGP